MHVLDSAPSRFSPSICAALVLLGALTLCGWQVLQQVRMAPGTVLPVGALTSKQATNDMRPTDAAVPASGPGWMELTAAQKLALRPLAERWSFLSELQKRRWLVLAQSFASLPAPEQAKLHERMTEWANLSAQQRNQARLNFATANKLAPDNKRAQWEAYQALSDSERRALAARGAPKPTGAATALRPISRRKLAQVPAAAESNPNRPNAPKIPRGIENSHRVIPIAIPPLAPPSAGMGSLQSGSLIAPSPGVETSPIAVPSAVPATLPPLSLPPSLAEPAAAVTPSQATPNTSGVYPQ